MNNIIWKQLQDNNLWTVFITGNNTVIREYKDLEVERADLIISVYMYINNPLK